MTVDKWTVRRVASWWAAISPTGWVTMHDTWDEAIRWALGGVGCDAGLVDRPRNSPHKALRTRQEGPHAAPQGEGHTADSGGPEPLLLHDERTVK